MRLLMIVLMVASVSLAEVWRIPDEIPTIQAALDTCADRDTVSVAIGTYVEALSMPPHFVFLIGDTNTQNDSLWRPVIDPSSLDSSTVLNCMALPEGASVSVERFAFRNSEAMYPRDFPGGIVYSTFDSVIVLDCLFDSVFHGIFPGNIDSRPRFLVERCEFFDMTYSSANLRGPAHIRDCLIHGEGVSGFGVFDSSIVERCHFTGNVQNNWLNTYRHHTMIRDNVFGPGIHGVAAMTITSRQGADSLIRNVFNCSTVTIGGSRNLSIVLAEGEPVVVQDNLFTDTTGSLSGFGILSYDMTGQVTEELHLIISNNLFENINYAGSTKAISIQNIFAGVEVRRNRFENLIGSGRVIEVDSNAHHYTINENYFSNTTYAIHNRSDFSLDARNNWYGHESGPFHATLNPDALGDSVNSDHPINFFPWLTDTSIFSATPEPGEPVEIPNSFIGNAYPNPFNSRVTIEFVLLNDQNITLDIYDLTGRHVANIFDGKMRKGAHIRDWSPDSQASGIYFARLVGNENVTSTLKLMYLK